MTTRTPTAATVDRETVTGNGSRPGASPVAPPRRRIRIPELAVGILVMVGFGLGAVLWHLSSTAKVPAVAAATEISRGDVVADGDLRVVYVSADGNIERLDSSDVATLVGRVALVDVAAGTLMTRALVADGTTLSDGDGVVGLALEPGQYPSLGLSPGDRVDVVRSGPADGANRVVAEGAVVVAIEELASDRKLVSIQASRDDAEADAAAAGATELRLVQVAP